MSLNFEVEHERINLVEEDSDADSEDSEDFFDKTGTQNSLLEVVVDVDLIDSGPGDTSYDDEMVELGENVDA